VIRSKAVNLLAKKTSGVIDVKQSRFRLNAMSLWILAAVFGSGIAGVAFAQTGVGGAAAR
jgi:hypothetical protein